MDMITSRDNAGVKYACTLRDSEKLFQADNDLRQFTVKKAAIKCSEHFLKLSCHAARFNRLFHFRCPFVLKVYF